MCVTVFVLYVFRTKLEFFIEFIRLTFHHIKFINNVMKKNNEIINEM